MAFVKGDTRINRKGRVKGSVNASTKEVRSVLVEVFDKNIEYIHTHIEKLTLQQRLQLNKDILPYIASKQESEYVDIYEKMNNEIKVNIHRLPEWMDDTASN
jgi:aspartate-semialdehyde dehydrogenase